MRRSDALHTAIPSSAIKIAFSSGGSRKNAQRLSETRNVPWREPVQHTYISTSTVVTLQLYSSHVEVTVKGLFGLPFSKYFVSY